MSGNEDSRVALERWYDVVDKASWRNFSEIKVDFPATDYVCLLYTSPSPRDA